MPKDTSFADARSAWIDPDAEAAQRARTLVLASLSHEIRTPLNGVLGMAQAMAADELSSAQRDRLEIIRQSGEALLVILNDMLGLAEDETQVEAREPPPRPAPASDRPLRLLAAEDNPVNQVVLRALLEQAGIEPFIVDDGAAVVDAWRASAWDVILMDIQMPVMDGLGATRAIRAAERATGRPRTPIVALTANTLSRHVAEYTATGMDGLISKPIHVEELFSAIDAALDLAEAEPQVAATA